MLFKLPEHRQHNVNYRWYSRLMTIYRSSKIALPFLNPFLIFILKTKYEIDKKIILNFYKKNKLDYLIKNKQLFFCFASFRSGTVFLTNLLISELKNAYIEHESNIDDYLNYTFALFEKEKRISYIKDFKKFEILYRMNKKKKDFKIYGEINPFLRLHSSGIKQCFPNAKLFHLVRNGKDVVRSILSREILSKKDPMNKLIKIPIDDKFFSKWDKMTRFEKVCWQWQYDNLDINKNVSHIVHFEKIKSNYEYFDEKINHFLGIKITKKKWQEHINNPKNITTKYRFPEYKDWTMIEKKQFKNICANAMEILGYEI